MSSSHHPRLAIPACVALALLLVLGPALALGADDVEGSTEPADQYALEFGEPDPDPDHPEDEQRVLEDPAGWSW